MAYSTIDDPEKYFQTKIYAGDGQSSKAVTLDGDTDLSPDFVWIKNRSGTDVNALYDSVRGVNKNLRSDATAAEGSQSDGLLSFDSDGFTVGAAGSVNTNANNFVSWNWLAETAFSNDASATSVGTIDTSGAIQANAGFSIITWTGNATSSQSVAHGLGAVPKVIFTKNTDNASQPWKCYFEFVGNGDYLILNATDTPATSGVWSSTTPTSSIISISNDTGINGSGNTILAYCFTDIKGYHKTGRYHGNGNADGTFVFTGFRPALIMVRDPGNAENWLVYDNKRPGYNLNNNHMMWNSNTAETASSANTMDILSNGFKVRSSNNGLNRNGAHFMYMAWAESPFVNSNNVPTNAR